MFEKPSTDSTASSVLILPLYIGFTSCFSSTARHLATKLMQLVVFLNWSNFVRLFVITVARLVQPVTNSPETIVLLC